MAICNTSAKMVLARKERIPVLISILEESNIQQLSALSSSLGDMIYFVNLGALLVCGRVFVLFARDHWKTDNPLESKVFQQILQSKEVQSHLQGNLMLYRVFSNSELDLLLVLTTHSSHSRQDIAEALREGTVYKLLIGNTISDLRACIRILVSGFARAALSFIGEHQPSLTVLRRMGAGYSIHVFVLLDLYSSTNEAGKRPTLGTVIFNGKE